MSQWQVESFWAGSYTLGPRAITKRLIRAPAGRRFWRRGRQETVSVSEMPTHVSVFLWPSRRTDYETT
jgi:hypothetical protein